MLTFNEKQAIAGLVKAAVGAEAALRAAGYSFTANHLVEAIAEVQLNFPDTR